MSLWTADELNAAKKEAVEFRALFMPPEDHDQGEAGSGDTGE